MNASRPGLAIRPALAFKFILFVLAGGHAAFAQDTGIPDKIVRPGVKEVQLPFASLKPSATFKIGGSADWVLLGDESVWVAGSRPFSLERIDPATNGVIATIELPGETCSGLELAFGSLWVPLCAKTPSLVRVDISTNKISAILTAGPAAPEGGIAASGDSIWMVTEVGGELSRIDPATNAVRQKIQIAPGSFNPIFSDGIVWISGFKTDVVTAVDASTGAVLATIPVGPKPRFLTAGGGSIWTLNQGDGTVTRIDARNRKVVATISAGVPGPGGDICYGADKVWVSVFDVPLTLIDPGSNRVVRQWVGRGGDSLRVGGDSIWLTDYFRGLLWRIPSDETLKK
jgi:virginiamycin B lyase